MKLACTSLLHSILLVIALTSCSDWTINSAQKTAYKTPNIETLDVVGSPGINSVSVRATSLNLSEAPLTKLGICYSINNATPTIADQTVGIDKDLNGIKTFVIDNLASGKTYTYRSYAISRALPNVPAYGAIKTFTTAEILPQVSTVGLANPAGPTSVQAIVQLHNLSQTIPQEIGICFSLNNSMPTLADNVNRNNVQSEFRALNTFTLNNLAPATVYYYRGYAVAKSQPNQPIYGSVMSFNTPSR